MVALIGLAGCEPSIKSGIDFGSGNDGGNNRDGAAEVDLSDSKLSDLMLSDPSDLKKSTDLTKSPDGNWGPCTVSGQSGSCISTSECMAQGMTSTPGLCPGPSNVQCCTDVAGGIDGGSTGNACPSTSYPTPNDGFYSSPGEQLYDGTCPVGMVAVLAFCMDKYEASLYTVDNDGNVIGSWSPYKNPGSTRLRAASVAGAIPQGYINQLQAGKACTEAGKRLCTNTEWRQACQGPSGLTYPYGSTRIDNRCNDESDRDKHPVVECFNSTQNWIWSKLSDPGISQQPLTVEPAGNKSECVSPYGVNDLMGNLHEWTSDPAGTFQGGFYFDTKINGNGCLYRTTAHDVSHWDYSTGFRCCK